MHLRVKGLALVACLSGCAQQMTSTPVEQASSTEASAQMSSDTQADIKWLEYADAVADANMAIEKKDFHLLAFSNRSINLPGIDLQEHPLARLQEVCGIKMLAGGGDMLQSDDELQRRKLLRAYATRYNQTVLRACQKHHDIR